jgi:hypothetical protein
MPPRRKATMTTEHKAALAVGRSEGLTVRRYLEALEGSKPRRGRQVSAEKLQQQLDTIASKLAGAEPLERLHLLQEQRNLESRRDASTAGNDLGQLEAAFVEVAASYGGRKGIDYATWRDAGVPTEVLRKAGISR